MLPDLSKQEFEEYLRDHDVAAVDFTSQHCTPCQLLKPIVEQLASDYTGKAGVAMLDVHENRDVVIGLRISSVPTMVFFKNGKAVDRIVGLRSKTDYAQILDRLLNAPPPA